jgi:hypothetical protein
MISRFLRSQFNFEAAEIIKKPLSTCLQSGTLLLIGA